MANVTIDLSGTSATAVLTTLRVERDRLKKELQSVERTLEQLEKLGELPMPERTEGGNIKHGQTVKAVMDYFLTVAFPYEASQDQIMQHLGTTRTSTYRALKKLESDGRIRLTENGNWITIPGK